MTASDTIEAGTSTGFGVKDFKAVAVAYRGAKALVDAASRFDSLDDAVAALTDAYGSLESMAENGAGYTPDTDQGFGSDNGRVIAESLLGIRNTVTATRKAFAALGK